MKQCLFCGIGNGEIKPDAVVYEDDHVIAIFDRMPVAEYHTLVIPKRHSKNIFDVQEADLVAMTLAIRRICQMYREKLGIEDVQIICSNGAVAQQDTFHFHVHILPRKVGDGLDIGWTPDISICARFDDLLLPLVTDL